MSGRTGFRVTAPMPCVTEVRKVPCPVCAAKSGDQCVGPTGATRQHNHRARLQLVLARAA